MATRIPPLNLIKGRDTSWFFVSVLLVSIGIIWVFAPNFWVCLYIEGFSFCSFSCDNEGIALFLYFPPVANFSETLLWSKSDWRRPKCAVFHRVKCIRFCVWMKTTYAFLWQCWEWWTIIVWQAVTNFFSSNPHPSCGIISFRHLNRAQSLFFFRFAFPVQDLLSVELDNHLAFVFFVLVCLR